MIERKNFIDHVEENIHPKSRHFISYWREVKRKCIEGYWIGGTYMPGSLYFYTNVWKINLMADKFSKSRVIGHPRLRDLEWEKAYLYLEARGFSGFIYDTEITCLHIIKDLDVDNPDYSKIKKNYPSGFKQDGSVKTYETPRSYLRKVHKGNLGRPLFENSAKNCMEIGSRRLGKTEYIAGGFLAHNFLFDGYTDYDLYELHRKSKNFSLSETLVGAIDTKFSSKVISSFNFGVDNLPGGGKYGTKTYPAPLYKYYSGSIRTSNGEIIASRDVKENGTWVKKGTNSKVYHRSFADNPLAGNGTGSTLIVIDEVGFMGNLIEVLGSLKDSTIDMAGGKFGTIWLSGCVCKGTKVWTNDGRSINIEDLQQEDGIIGYNGTEYSKEPITWIQEPRKKPCYRITTAGGDTLECSEDHPIMYTRRKALVDKGSKGKFKKISFKRADEIEIKDQLIVLDKIPIFGECNIEDARLLGLLIGDGNYNSGVSLYTGNEEVFDYVKSRYAYKVVKQFKKKTEEGDFRALYLKGLLPLLREAGMYNQTKDNKRLPSNIASYDRESLCELIGGYFDADGSIKHDKKKKAIVVSLTSVVKPLLEQVQQQLLKLGIRSSIVKEKKEGFKVFKEGTYFCKTGYVLYVNRHEDVIRFADSIKLLCNYKQDTLNIAYTLIKKSRFNIGKNIFVPNSIGKGKYFEDMVNMEGISYKTVTSIEYIGEQDVYNLTAGNTNTYIANGFITHNTSGDMERGSSLAAQEVFYNPEEYDMITFDDEWEDRGKICCFLSAAYSLEEFKDVNGYTDVKASTDYWEKERIKAKKSKSPSVLNNLLQYRPLKPSEAFLVIDGGKFPVAELRDISTKVLSDDVLTNSILNVEFNLEGKEPVMVSSKKPTLNKYKISSKIDDVDCAIQILSPVKKRNDNTVFSNRYIASFDPTDDDDTQGGSLMAAHILDTFTDQIVASYVSKPRLVKQYYEQFRRLLMYYKATCLYEKNKKGFYQYIETKNSLYLLEPTPKFLEDYSMQKVSTIGNQKYGVAMTGNLKLQGWVIDLIVDWLEHIPNTEAGLRNIDMLWENGLIEELIVYNGIINTDRVSSLKMLMIHRENNIKHLDLRKSELNTAKQQKINDFFNKRYKGKSNKLTGSW